MQSNFDMLSAINPCLAVQRRKNVEDERGMRNLMKEGSLVCVEVQKVGQDGVLMLAARTSKFGKVCTLFFLDVLCVPTDACFKV